MAARCERRGPNVFLNEFSSGTRPVEHSLAVKRARRHGKIFRITFLSEEFTAKDREIVRGSVPAESTTEPVHRPGRTRFFRPICLPNRQHAAVKDEIVLKVRSFVLPQDAEPA
jgi:hypothetical protein